MVDTGQQQQTDFLEADADRGGKEREEFADDAWRGQVPPPLLEQLDHAAGRLADLERRGMRLSLAVEPGCRPRCELRRRGRGREIALRRLLAFLAGERGSASSGWA